MANPSDLSGFAALCDRLTEFAERDAIPIASAIAQEQLNRQRMKQESASRKTLAKPSITKAWKLKKPEVTIDAGNATLAGNALAEAISEGLQEQLNRII